MLKLWSNSSVCGADAVTVYRFKIQMYKCIHVCKSQPKHHWCDASVTMSLDAEDLTPSLMLQSWGISGGHCPLHWTDVNPFTWNCAVAMYRACLYCNYPLIILQSWSVRTLIWSHFEIVRNYFRIVSLDVKLIHSCSQSLSNCICQ